MSSRVVIGFGFYDGYLFEVENNQKSTWFLRLDGKKDVRLKFIATDSNNTRYFEEGFLDVEKLNAVINGEIYWGRMLSQEECDDLLY